MILLNVFLLLFTSYYNTHTHTHIPVNIELFEFYTEHRKALCVVSSYRTISPIKCISSCYVEAAHCELGSGVALRRRWAALR